MSNIQTGAERMPHDLSHLGFLAGQIGRLITISTTPVIAGDSFEMDAVGALRLSPLRREIGRAVQQECRDRARMPSSACKNTQRGAVTCQIGQHRNSLTFDTGPQWRRLAQAMRVGSQ